MTFSHWFAPWLQPANASLAYTLMIPGLNAVLIWPFHRKRIFLRI